MRVGGTDRPTVFFFGAGATRGAVGHVLLNNKRIKPPLNGDFFQVADRFAAGYDGNAARQHLARLNDFLDRVHPKKTWRTMESAFSLLYTAKDFPSIYKRGPGRRPASGFSQEMASFWWLMTRVLCEISREDEVTGYDDLAAILGPNDTIATLNYDLACDAALVRAGWDPRNGYALGGGKRKIEWEPTTTTERLKDVRLLKLHGSLNWWIKGALTELNRIFDNKPRIVSRPRSNDYTGHLRQIAPPMYGKAFRHSHWADLWKLAYRALCDAEVLVVVGCGIIDTDYHLRAFLTSMCGERKRDANRFHTAFFVDKLKVRKQWQGVLKGAFHRYETHTTFERFLRSQRT